MRSLLVPRNPLTTSAETPPVEVTPAAIHSTVCVADPPHRPMHKAEAGPPVLLAEPILDIRDCRSRHKKRAGDLQQRRPLDRLHDTPEVSRIVSQVTKPAATRPCLELHRHRLLRRRIQGTNLLADRLEATLS